MVLGEERLLLQCIFFIHAWLIYFMTFFLADCSKCYTFEELNRKVKIYLTLIAQTCTLQLLTCVQTKDL